MVSFAEGKNAGNSDTDLMKNGDSASGFAGNQTGNDPVSLAGDRLTGTIVEALETILIQKPAAGVQAEFDLTGGQKYVFDFSENLVKSFARGAKDLTIQFADNAQITLKNFSQALTGENPAVLEFAEGGEKAGFEIAGVMKVMQIQVAAAAEEEEQGNTKPKSELRSQDEQAQNVSAVEPAAGEMQNDYQNYFLAESAALDEAAERAADIEPAAGGERRTTGAIGGSGGGYGFQSSFEASGVKPLSDTGPINPTALKYGLPSLRRDFGASAGEREDIAGVADDTPVVNSSAVFVDETNLPYASASGAVDVDYGRDAAGGVRGSGVVQVGYLTSGGVAVEVIFDADTNIYRGVAGGITVFTLEISPGGEYQFHLLAPIDHPDVNDPDDVLSLEFGVIAEDEDGDSAQGVITVNVSDDGVSAFDDTGVYTQAAPVVQGDVTGNDDLSKDVPNLISKISFGAHEVDVDANAGTDIDGLYGTLHINADGTYSYTLFDGSGTGISSGEPDNFCEEFVYTLKDGDGDSDTAVLKITGELPQGKLIVGQNINDDAQSTTEHLVGGGKGVISGGAGHDILVGDAGGSVIETQTQDYNFVFVLDVSGSMAYTEGGAVKIELLKDAVKSLLSDMSNYDNGEIKVHIVPFSTTAQPAGTFDLTQAGSLTAIDAYIDALKANGYTNYESPMQAAIQWLQGSEPLGGNAITSTYFISDGAPNRYTDAGGAVAKADANGALGEVLGTDGTNEAAILHGLNDHFIAVGVDIGVSIARLDKIDPTGHALNIDDPADLKFALAATNPIKTLNAAGSDVLEGGGGHDILFGDILFTDTLSSAHGLSVEGGAGWEVFERLESGESLSDPSWDRDDTIAYILSHAAELSQESLDGSGQGRSGGDDILRGGSGEDLIFGQEGDDVIIGGIGDDTLFGGSGSDLFTFDTLSDGIDTVKDFDVADGDRLDLSVLLTAYDPLIEDIRDFLIATEAGGNTSLAIDVSGSGGISGSVDFVTLEGVTGLDLDVIVKSGVV